MSKTKEELIQEFEELKAMEQEAHGFYLKIVNDPAITDDEIKTALQKISEDETQHVKLVSHILSIIENNL